MVALGNLGTALRTVQTALWTNQHVLDVVANNVANVNTPGYTRKIAQLQEQTLAGTGVGVEVAGLGRSVDENLQVMVRQETGILKAAEIISTFEGRIQDLFGTPESNTSIAHMLSEFQSAVESLAAAPDGSIEQRDLVRWGQEVAANVNQMSDNVQRLRAEADQRIAQDVNEVSSLLQNVAALNAKIVRAVYQNQDTNDLKDDRDRALGRLSELMDVRVTTRARGDVLVFTSTGRTLLDGDPMTLTHNPAAQISPLTTHDEGDIGGIYLGEAISTNDLTGIISGGELGGLIKLRDTTLPDMQSTIDQMAATLKDTVNQIHNQGLAFPGATELQGTRVFADPAAQTISLGAGSDVAISLFNRSGDQAATTMLSGLMGGTGPFTIDDLATALQTWLQGNGAATAEAQVGADGRLAIDLHSSPLGLAFRDQASATPGDTAQDADIGFDADGDGDIDETHQGFSAFFGLNDFFVGGLGTGITESNVLAADYRALGNGTVAFTDATGVLGTVNIATGDSLATIADKISQLPGLTVTTVRDGIGERLRITSADGSPFVVTESAGTLIDELGLHDTTTGIGASLAVRDDIAADPSRVSRGVVQYDANRGATGAYFVSRNDGTAIVDLAKALATGTDFATAGTISRTTETVVRYASRILGESAARAAGSKQNQEFQNQFVENLKTKADSISGVNLDQELSDMLLFEQAYSAAARVMTTIQKMFESLDSAVR